MVRDVRLKGYKFPIGSLTASAGGIVDVYSDHPLNGTIHKLQWEAGNHTATGSLYVSISGAVSEDIIQTFRSGTSFGNVGSDWTKYPVIDTVSVTLGSAVLSSDKLTKININSPVRLVGSGLGNGTSGLGFTVYYI